MPSPTTKTSYTAVLRGTKQPNKRSESSSSESSGQPHPKLALILPALREADNLLRLLNRTRRVLERLETPYEILVVDDDSRDGTTEIVSAIARRDPRVRLLVRTGERGLAGAVLHGWQSTDATILGVMDADGQHPPELLPTLLELILEGRDLAIASRFTRGAIGGRWSPFRRTISSAAILATRPLQSTWMRVRDPLSGFFLVRRRCVENVLFQPAGFKLLLEVLVRGSIQTVEEVPFAFARRNAGRSKVSVQVAWDYLSLLARLYAAKFGASRIPQVTSGDYSGSPIAVHRSSASGWLFPQEKATFKDAGKGI